MKDASKPTVKASAAIRAMRAFGVAPCNFRWWGSAGHAGMRVLPKKALELTNSVPTKSEGVKLAVPVKV